jgi:DivIVA domain-containing protein
MSVFQPDAESGPQTASGLPAFQVVRRGYDRHQVDAYLTDLAVRLQEADTRVDRAERARHQLQAQVAALRDQESPTFERLGAEAATVLEQAGRSAALLVEKAKGRAETIVEEARRTAEQVRAEADREAQTALQAAHEAAERVRNQLQQERLAMDSETEQVREFRDGLLDDLARVHADINALLERTRSQRLAVPVAAPPPADADQAAPADDRTPEPAAAEAE